MIQRISTVLLEHMRTIPDYRCDREKPHDHAEMLTYLVAGYLNDRASVGCALCWCEDNQEMLKKHMVLKQGIASEATANRLHERTLPRWKISLKSDGIFAIFYLYIYAISWVKVFEQRGDMLTKRSTGRWNVRGYQ